MSETNHSKALIDVFCTERAEIDGQLSKTTDSGPSIFFEVTPSSALFPWPQSSAMWLRCVRPDRDCQRVRIAANDRRD